MPSDRSVTKHEDTGKAACDDWTKIAMNCLECGVQFFRKVKGQRHCEEHRHLAGTQVLPKEAFTSNPVSLQVKQLRARRDVRDDSANNGWRNAAAPAFEVAAADTIERLRAALEGLHFHHKAFEPDCRHCQAALSGDSSAPEKPECEFCPNPIDQAGVCLECWNKRQPLPVETSARVAEYFDIFPATGCGQCPWTVGDTYQRDCDFPDCSPRWKPSQVETAAPETGGNEGIKCTHCNGMGCTEQHYDEEQGWSENEECTTCGATGRIRTVEQYLKTLPANWHEDSSLETWFPLSSEEHARYKQALTRANGFLIMHGHEPVKLEYVQPSVQETTASRRLPDAACGNPVMVNAEWYGPCTRPSGHDGECTRAQKASGEQT